MDDGVRRGRINLGGVGPLELGDVAGEFNGGQLHAVAQSEVRDAVLAGVADRQDFSLDAALAKSAWDNDAAVLIQLFNQRRIFLVGIGVNPVNLGPDAVFGGGMLD